MLYMTTPVDSNSNSSPRKYEHRVKGNLAQVEGHASPSLVGRGKKWTDRLTRFHIGSGSSKRKKNKNKVPESLPLMGPPMFLSPECMVGSPSPSTPKSTSSFPFTQLSSELVKTVGSPTSNQLPHNQTLEGEPGAFLPFFPATNSHDEAIWMRRSSKKKSYLYSTCTLCGDPTSSRNNGERILELECGHLAHQECLLVSFSSEASAISNLQSLFPQCNQCWKQHWRRVRCIPKESDLADQLISNILLNKSSEMSASPSVSQEANMYSGVNIHSSSTVNNHQQSVLTLGDTPALGSTPHSFSEPMFTALQDPSSVRGFSRVLESKNTSRAAIPMTHSFHSVTPSPTSSSVTHQPNLRPPITRQYSIGSLFSISTSATNESIDVSIAESQVITRKETSSPSVPLLRSYFLNVLIAKFGQEITASDLDSKYGLLKVVDELLVSFDSINYLRCWCYLFKNALIFLHVALGKKDSDDSHDPLTTSIFQRDFENIDTFLPIAVVNVVPVDSSILKCEFQFGEGMDHSRTVYFKESSGSNENKVIQKWITAFLDPDLLFNGDCFTSTLPPPPIITGISDAPNESSTFAGLVKPDKMVGVSTLTSKHTSIITRRGFTLPADSIMSHDTNNTIASLIPTFRYIISIKCSVPDDLVVVLQIQFPKLRTKHEFNVLHNSLIALALKFPSFHTCILDQNGYVLTHSTIGDLIQNYQSIEEMANLRPKTKFDPLWLRKLLYPEDISFNLGVAVISNCDMDEGRSCLFWDYGEFKRKGTSRVNEIKIRVGYLNMDYTDKIEELIEVDTWDFLLEAVCCAFNLNFENESQDTKIF